MRTPRLTWVSEGKPRRRLLIFSKEHLFAAALDCHGLLLFIKSFISIPTIHLHRRFAPGSIQQNHHRARGLLTHHRDDRLQVGHDPDKRAVPDQFSWQLTVVIWYQTPAVCRQQEAVFLECAGRMFQICINSANRDEIPDLRLFSCKSKLTYSIEAILYQLRTTR